MPRMEQPLMPEPAKSQVAVFVPYRKRNSAWEFYLQKRTMDAKINPGLLGTFGGTIEDGETPDEALLREVQEELAYVPQHHRYFSRYENSVSIRYVYIEEVGDDFESKVVIGEGDYGTFVPITEMQDLHQFTRTVQSVVPELANALKKLAH